MDYYERKFKEYLEEKGINVLKIGWDETSIYADVQKILEPRDFNIGFRQHPIHTRLSVPVSEFHKGRYIDGFFGPMRLKYTIAKHIANEFEGDYLAPAYIGPNFSYDMSAEAEFRTPIIKQNRLGIIDEGDEECYITVKMEECQIWVGGSIDTAVELCPSDVDEIVQLAYRMGPFNEITFDYGRA